MFQVDNFGSSSVIFQEAHLTFFARVILIFTQSDSKIAPKSIDYTRPTQDYCLYQVDIAQTFWVIIRKALSDICALHNQ